MPNSNLTAIPLFQATSKTLQCHFTQVTKNHFLVHTILYVKNLDPEYSLVTPLVTYRWVRFSYYLGQKISSAIVEEFVLQGIATRSDRRISNICVFHNLM